MMICVLISQSILTLRTLLEGAFVPLAFMVVLFSLSIVFYFVLAITPIINPEKFLDDKHELTPEVLSKWWDHYKHPLTVKSSITKKQNNEINQCITNLLSPIRKSYGYSTSTKFIKEIPSS